MLGFLLFILTAHMIGDYLLQTDYIATNKGKDNYILLVHSVLYNFGILIVGIVFGVVFTWEFYILNIVLHFIIDYLKARGITTKFMSGKNALIVDQLLHYGILIVATFINLISK